MEINIIWIGIAWGISMTTLFLGYLRLRNSHYSNLKLWEKIFFCVFGLGSSILAAVLLLLSVAL